MSSHVNGKDEVNILEKMTIEELEDILKMDASSFTDESDADYILKVLEVIEKKEKANSSGKSDIDVAWKSFQEDYIPTISREELELVCKKDKPKVVKLHKPFYKVASIAIVFILAFIGSISVASSILNQNVWGAIAEWGKEQFGFDTISEGMQEESSLNNVLKEYGVNDIKIPNVIPKWYRLKSIDVFETPKKKKFVATYGLERKELTVIVDFREIMGVVDYEKNENVDVYTKGDISYYIMKNYDQIQAIWIDDNYECSIRGDISETELKEMIDSI